MGKGNADSDDEENVFGLSGREEFHEEMGQYLGCCVVYHQELLE
jgi:hypothetical protein